jgi:prepilin-type N-terminal cleavage/methylation domain-containing protein
VRRSIECRRPRAGMTLVELLVGLAITGMVTAIAYAAFGTLADHHRRADVAAQAALRESAVRHTLLAWLAGARLTVEEDGPQFRALDGAHEGRPDDELSFLTTARTPLGDAETIVRLFVDRDDRTPERGLVAELSEWRGTRVELVELEPRATGLDARYVSGALGQRQWLPTWISSSVLPAGAELVLTSAPGDTLPPLLRLPLVVSFEGGR